MLGRASKARSLRGPGSVLAKGFRDGRRGMLLAILGLGACVLAVGQSTAANYASVASRQQQLASVQQTPGMGSLFGVPIGVETLGGLIHWRDASLIVLLLGMWSIVALSGAIAGEVGAGSGEMLLGAPLPRRRIAAEKLGAHVATLGIVAVALAATAWLTGIVYYVLPGDSISFLDGLADFGGMALLALAGGAAAFALSQWFGRGTGVGLAVAAFLGSYFVFAYAELVAAFGAIQWLSPFRWLAYHQPLAGSWNVAGLCAVAVLDAALLAVGVVAFERRDVGRTIPLPRLVLPGRAWFLRGPARRTFLDLRSTALAWGIGLGLATGLIALASQSLASAATSDPGSERFVRQVFGDTDWTSAKGLMQLAFVWFGYVIVALAATTLMRGLASDERERRLEMVLATPVSRVRLLLSGGLGVFAAIGLMSLVIATTTALGVAGSGQDPFGPFAGAWVAGLYAAALAGVALACLGLGGVELAPAIPAALGIGFFAFDTFGSLLQLPSPVTSLSLTHHLGRPMAGSYDWPGMVLLAVLALGGLALGAWGMTRRDVSR
jgi:ABC-2 type transport system permease protein